MSRDVRTYTFHPVDSPFEERVHAHAPAQILISVNDGEGSSSDLEPLKVKSTALACDLEDFSKIFLIRSYNEESPQVKTPKMLLIKT